ncbi:MAG: hypothetical protein WDW38_010336 [Sanguina aurantia]
MDRDLRGKSSRFVGLPPAEDLIIGGADSYRFFRQDSPYWRDFHTGVLSTGCLKEALGFNEPMASKLVGYKKLGSNHHSLLGVYEQLLELPLMLELQSSAAETVAAANMAALCEAYESSEVHRLGMSSRQQKQRQSQHAQEVEQEAEGRLRHCAAASRSGISGVRCAWGSLQEASTLAAVMDLFPHATVHEVGMCHVDTANLPTHWGLNHANLPPLAASPDGIICHPVSLHPAQLQQLQQHCTLSRTSACADESHYAPHSPTPKPAPKPVNSSTPLSALSIPFNPDVHASAAHTGRQAGGGSGDSAKSELQQSHEAWLLLGQLLGDVAIAAHPATNAAHGNDSSAPDAAAHPTSRQGATDAAQASQGSQNGQEGTHSPSSAHQHPRTRHSSLRAHGDNHLSQGMAPPIHFATAAVCSVGPAVAVTPQQVTFGPLSLSRQRYPTEQRPPSRTHQSYPSASSTAAASTVNAGSAAAATAAAAMAARLLPSSMARPSTHLGYAKALQAATPVRPPAPPPPPPQSSPPSAQSLPASTAAAASTAPASQGPASTAPAGGSTPSVGPRSGRVAQDTQGARSRPQSAAAAAAGAAALQRATGTGGVAVAVDPGARVGGAAPRPVTAPPPAAPIACAPQPALSPSSPAGAAAAAAAPPFRTETLPPVSAHAASSSPPPQPSSGLVSRARAPRTAWAALPPQPKALPATAAALHPAAATPTHPTHTVVGAEEAAVALAGRVTISAAAAAATDCSGTGPGSCPPAHSRPTEPSNTSGFRRGAPSPASSEAAAVTAASGRCAAAVDELPAAASPTAPVVVQRANAVLREVVEIKNGCPFGERSARSGGRGDGFVINDRGPRDMVSAMWVPQLQLHMLASGCASGLLVSRSATKGVRVFRMYRDDPYLATMLSLVSRFHTSHVLQRKPPPVNMFSTDPTYIQFLYRTLQLARRAKEVVCCSDLPLPHGVDDRAFV